MGLYSLVTLIKLKMNEMKMIFVQAKAVWYDKNSEMTFADTIMVVKKNF